MNRRDAKPLQFADDEPIKMAVAEMSFEGESYSLKAFVDHYSSQLPLVARVSEGFCSPDEGKFTFSVEDTYWISHVKKQKRIIGKSEEDLNFSIPFDHPARFYVLEQGEDKWGPSNLEDIFHIMEYDPGKQVHLQPLKSEQVTVWQGAESQDVMELTTMLLMDTYEETFLVGSPIIMRELHDYRCPIPVFVPIRLTRATGLLNSKKPKLFDKELDKIKDFTKIFPNAEAKGNPEIMVFTDEQVDAYGGDYEYIDPYEVMKNVKMPVGRKRYEAVTLGPTLPPPGTRPPPIAVRATPSRTPSRLPAPPPGMRAPPDGGTLPRLFKERSPAPSSPHVPITVHKKLHGLSIVNECSGVPQVAKPTPIPTTEVTPPHILEARHTEALYDPYEIRDEEVYAELSQVPRTIDFKLVTKKQMGEFLRLLKLHKYIELFDQEDIDGPLLLELNREDLKNDFKFSGTEATKLMKFVKDGWRPT